MTFRLVHCLLILLIVSSAWPALAAGIDSLPNVALHKTATASKSRGNATPDKAFDGNLSSRWSSNDGRANAWLQVDLGKPHELGGAEITWERDTSYVVIIEGSNDNETWTMLNDQRANVQRQQTERLALASTACRYVRLTVISLERGSWAIISEFKLFDSADMKTLAAKDAAAFIPTAPLPENFALKMPAIASSCEGSRTAEDATDGDSHTRWCASDITKPQWLEIDLKQPRDIRTVEIQWENQKRAYRFMVEGSADNVVWQMLADLRNNTEAPSPQQIKITGKLTRYIRITVTGIDAESWVSIVDVKVFGADPATN